MPIFNFLCFFLSYLGGISTLWITIFRCRKCACTSDYLSYYCDNIRLLLFLSCVYMYCIFLTIKTLKYLSVSSEDYNVLTVCQA
jgi:hypothetical protein